MTVVMSMWRNDEKRSLHTRVFNLLKKADGSGTVRFLWVVGDSSDRTEEQLRRFAEIDGRISLFRHDSGLIGEDVPTRRLRLAWTATQMFSHIRSTDNFACLHESDLKSPSNVIDLLSQNTLPVAGWPVIKFHDRTAFYDIFAYRHVDGRHFSSDEVKPKNVIEVSSFGSVWLAPAHTVKDRVLGVDCIVDLCKQWRSELYTLKVDPRIDIEQPVDLWEPC